MSRPSLTVVVNPASGRGKASEIGQWVVAQLGAEDVVKVLEPPEPTAVAPMISQALVAGSQRIILIGGDGLVHHALSALACNPVPVGLIPAGSGNDFATAMEIPANPEAALEIALGEKTKSVDLLYIKSTSSASESSWAASVVTAGFSTKVNASAETFRFPRGSSRYSLATLKELPKMKPTAMEIMTDDGYFPAGETPPKAVMIAIANSALFGGGMRVCPSASVCDSQLDLVFVKPLSRLHLALMLPLVFKGLHIYHPAVLTTRSTRVELRSFDQELWADGERLFEATNGRRDIIIETRPAVLNLCCP